MEELNLLDYIVPGMDVYSIIHQCKKHIIEIDPTNEMPILLGTKKYGKSDKHKLYRFNIHGSILKKGTDCLIFPDNKTNTWVGFQPPVLMEKGELVMAHAPNGELLVAVYSHYDREKQKNYCYHSVTDDGGINTREYDKISKFTDKYGWLHCKKAIAKQMCGRINNIIKKD